MSTIHRIQKLSPSGASLGFLDQTEASKVFDVLATAQSLAAMRQAADTHGNTYVVKSYSEPGDPPPGG